MSVNDVENASLRVEAMRTRLDEALADFRAGEPVQPDTYQRTINDLCKALLDLEEAES